MVMALHPSCTISSNSGSSPQARWLAMATSVTRLFGCQLFLHRTKSRAQSASSSSSQNTNSFRPLPKHLTPIPTLISRRSLSSPPPNGKRPVLSSLKLTELEERIFNTLKDVLLHFRLKTQLRVAGGWVRDKLLGEESDDIDIAIDDMLGKTFCHKVLWYFRKAGLESNGFGVIRSNPLQAKHLEVARMQIYGVAIDFVNLRPDHYADSSFVSTLQDFGTATEDAFRRDLTINSLFYNINTGMVEDPTGRGLPDLKAGIVATPLPAKSTFMDDPLRVLRALRFVASLDYELHADIKAAVDLDIRVALRCKISRERIGREVDRIFRANKPIKAIRQLVDLQLFPIIFCPPPELEMTLPEDVERSCLFALETVWEVLNHFGIEKLTVEDRFICLLAAFLSPLRAFQVEQKDKLVSLPFVIIKESLKMRTSDAAKVAALHQSAKDFTAIQKQITQLDIDLQEGVDHLENSVKSETSYSFLKYKAGLLLQEMKGLWLPALLLSSVLEDLEYTTGLPDEKEGADLLRRSKCCQRVEEAIRKLELLKVQNWYEPYDRTRAGYG